MERAFRWPPPVSPQLRALPRALTSSKFSRPPSHSRISARRSGALVAKAKNDASSFTCVPSCPSPCPPAPPPPRPPGLPSPWHQSVLETGVRSDRAGGAADQGSPSRCAPLQLRESGAPWGSVTPCRGNVGPRGRLRLSPAPPGALAVQDAGISFPGRVCRGVSGGRDRWGGGRGRKVL